jgi:hypothetical protein
MSRPDRRGAQRAWLDFGSKSLLLSACGLGPDPDALLAFAREFGEQHVFFELWNAEWEVATLRSARLANLYFLPVTAALDLVYPARMTARPNRRVFVSLGGDDDLELLQEVIRRRDDAHVFVPDRAWHKPSFGKVEFPVRMEGRNVTRVACWGALRFGQFTLAYRRAFAGCDTVLIATRAAERHRMRAGIRVADALAARKRLVMAQNTMCELLMAQHERTALVAPHDAIALADALGRALEGTFRPQRGLSDEIRRLTRDERKVAWMIDAARSPEKARGSPFRRDPDRLAEDIARLGLSVDDRSPVWKLSSLRQGQRLGASASYLVEAIHRAGDSTFEITLVRSGVRPLVAILSTVPLDSYFRRTSQALYLMYRGELATHEEQLALAELADLL